MLASLGHSRGMAHYLSRVFACTVFMIHAHTRPDSGLLVKDRGFHRLRGEGCGVEAANRMPGTALPRARAGAAQSNPAGPSRHGSVMGQSKRFRSFAERRKKVGKKTGYLVLTLGMAL